MNENNFRYVLETAAGNLTVLRIIGDLNEDSIFKDTVEMVVNAHPPIEKLAIDCSEMQTINSCGVRFWLLFLEKLQAAKPQFFFSSISLAFVEQANVVRGVLGSPTKKQVLKFEAPLLCSKCDHQLTQFIEAKSLVKGADGALAIPKIPCPKCSTPLDLDSFPDEFFAFLKP